MCDSENSESSPESCSCRNDYTILFHIGNGFLSFCLILAGLTFLYKLCREGYGKQYQRRNYVWIGIALLLHCVVFTVFIILPATIKGSTIIQNLGSGDSFWQIFVLVLFPFTSVFLFILEGLDVYHSTKPGRETNNSVRVGLVCIFTSGMVSGCTAVGIANTSDISVSVTCGDDNEFLTFSPYGFYVPLSLIGVTVIAILVIAGQNLTSNFIIRGRTDMVLVGRIRIVRKRITTTVTMFFLTITCLVIWYPAFYFRVYQQDSWRGVPFTYVVINFVLGIAFLVLFWTTENAVVDIATDDLKGSSVQERSSGAYPNVHVLTGDMPVQDQPPVISSLDTNKLDRDPEANVQHFSSEATHQVSPLEEGLTVSLTNPINLTSAVGGTLSVIQDAPAMSDEVGPNLESAMQCRGTLQTSQAEIIEETKLQEFTNDNGSTTSSW